MVKSRGTDGDRYNLAVVVVWISSYHYSRYDFWISHCSNWSIFCLDLFWFIKNHIGNIIDSFYIDLSLNKITSNPHWINFKEYFAVFANLKRFFDVLIESKMINNKGSQRMMIIADKLY